MHRLGGSSPFRVSGPRWRDVRRAHRAVADERSDPTRAPGRMSPGAPPALEQAPEPPPGGLDRQVERARMAELLAAETDLELAEPGPPRVCLRIVGFGHAPDVEAVDVVPGQGGLHRRH